MITIVIPADCKMMYASSIVQFSSSGPFHVSASIAGCVLRKKKAVQNIFET